MIALAKFIIEGQEIELDVVDAVHLNAHNFLKARDAITKTLLQGVLLDWIELGINLDSQKVLLAPELSHFRITKTIVVFADQKELRAHHIGLGLLLYALKSTTHHGNDHVEDNEQRKERTDHENEPEDHDVVRVIHEVTRNLEVTQSQSVRVNQTHHEAKRTLIGSLFRVEI